MRLHGKRIMITAAGQGIGRASALACAAEGAHVIATDLDQDALAALAVVDGRIIKTRRLDVLDPSAITELARSMPSLDGLFNCAGFIHNGSISECSDEDWDFSFNLNVKSMFRLIRAVLPSLLHRAGETGASAILNMALMASSVKGLPNRLAYGASKAAVIGLTKALAADHARQGLRCNAICPGTVDTPSLRGRIAASVDPVQAEEDFIARQPMGRLASVDDIAPMVVFLLSDESRFVTGQAVIVDGGATI